MAAEPSSDAASSVPSTPQTGELLHLAVEALGGAERPGQVTMAAAVEAAMRDGCHLLVQAGTGTGKSLAYLIPAFMRATATGKPVIVATATLALQAQLVGRDLPALVDAIGRRLGRVPSFAMLKGRHNYCCLHRVHDGVPDDQGALVEVRPSRRYGREVLALREWAKQQAGSSGTGDRDDAPNHGDRAWGQVSVSARECLGDRCAHEAECFAERARAQAMTADIVVTNHALLAIDALDGGHVLPDHDVVVIDEAHELQARVTSVASAELSPQMVERAVRRSGTYCDQETSDRLDAAAAALKGSLTGAEARRLELPLPVELADAVATVRDAARAVMSALPKSSAVDTSTGSEAGLRTARNLLEQVRDVAERIAGESPHDVVWVTVRESAGPELQVAPLSVSGLLRAGLFAERTVVSTSATLQLGGSFDASAQSIGLRISDRVDGSEPGGPAGGGVDHAGLTGAGAGVAGSDGSHPSDEPESAVEPLPWRGLDVGSPFDYGKQAILYVARHLPDPGRGISEAALTELCGLVEALGGATLGLFSSRRAAEEAAAAVRERVGAEVLCQGEAQLPELSRRFVAEPDTCLFGTLSLWQGLDVPGDTCQLVVIDRLPFPRPDDPLMSARQRAVTDAGGNGFMAVAATHAALLLAQGVGRLIRRTSDRGVVAVLDPRLSTKRYGSYLRASLPPMWSTTDPAVVRGALTRLRRDVSSEAVS